jgi:hypothetical protein
MLAWLALALAALLVWSVQRALSKAVLETLSTPQRSGAPGDVLRVGAPAVVKAIAIETFVRHRQAAVTLHGGPGEPGKPEAWPSACSPRPHRIGDR